MNFNKTSAFVKENINHSEPYTRAVSPELDKLLPKSEIVMRSVSQLSPEMQSVVKKIIGKNFHIQVKKKGSGDWKNQISAASKKINILKNIQNKIFIKAAVS